MPNEAGAMPALDPEELLGEINRGPYFNRRELDEISEKLAAVLDEGAEYRSDASIMAGEFQSDNRGMIIELLFGRLAISVVPLYSRNIANFESHYGHEYAYFIKLAQGDLAKIYELDPNSQRAFVFQCQYLDDIYSTYESQLAVVNAAIGTNRTSRHVVFAGRASVHSRFEYYDLAIKDYKVALSEYKATAYLLNLVKLLLESRRYQEARQIFLTESPRLIDLNEGDAANIRRKNREIIKTNAITAFHVGEYQRVFELTDNLVHAYGQRNPEATAELHVLRAKSYKMLRQYADARRELNRIPENIYANLELVDDLRSEIEMALFYSGAMGWWRWLSCQKPAQENQSLLTHHA